MRAVFSKKEENKKPLISAVNIAYGSGLLLFAIAVLQLVITIIYPVGQNTRPFDVYSRNISAIVVYAILGVYLTSWSVYKQKKHHSRSTMKTMKIITIIVIVSCIIKAILAFYYTATQFNPNHFSWIYYVGEVLAWASLSIYFITYLKSKHRKRETSSETSHHHRHHLTEKERKMDKVAKNQE